MFNLYGRDVHIFNGQTRQNVNHFLIIFRAPSVHMRKATNNKLICFQSGCTQKLICRYQEMGKRGGFLMVELNWDGCIQCGIAALRGWATMHMWWSSFGCCFVFKKVLAVALFSKIKNIDLWFSCAIGGMLFVLCNASSGYCLR